MKKKIEIVSKAEATLLMMKAGSKIFTVGFRKRSNGEIRKMNCRLNVKSKKGGKLPYNPYNVGLIPVFDMKKGGYRMIDVNSVFALNINGRELYVK